MSFLLLLFSSLFIYFFNPFLSSSPSACAGELHADEAQLVAPGTLRVFTEFSDPLIFFPRLLCLCSCTYLFIVLFAELVSLCTPHPPPHHPHRNSNSTR